MALELTNAGDEWVRASAAKTADGFHIANAKVDDEALRALANDRARAVKDALVATGIADDRVFLIAPRLGGDAGGDAGGYSGRNAGGAPTAAPPTRVDLALR